MGLKEGGVRGSLRNVSVGAASIPDSGISRWEFEQNVLDSWGPNDGTDNSSAGYSTDSAVGTYAKDLDGTDDWVDTGGSILDTTTTGTWSISAWVKPNSDGAVYTEGNSSSVDPFLIFDINSDVGRLNLRENTTVGTVVVNGTTTITDGAYHHIVATFDAGDMVFYTDGVQEDTNTYTNGDINVDRSAIGALARNSISLYYDNLIDDLRLYDKALSSTEVSNLESTGSISG